MVGRFWFLTVIWGCYFKVSSNRQICYRADLLRQKEFLEKTLIYQRNLAIFLYPKLIRFLKVSKRDKFLCESSFTGLIFDTFCILRGGFQSFNSFLRRFHSALHTLSYLWKYKSLCFVLYNGSTILRNLKTLPFLDNSLSTCWRF